MLQSVIASQKDFRPRRATATPIAAGVKRIRGMPCLDGLDGWYHSGPKHKSRLFLKVMLKRSLYIRPIGILTIIVGWRSKPANRLDMYRYNNNNRKHTRRATK